MKVGVGIIGMGWMGQIHAKLAATIDNCQLVAICDTDQKKLESLNRKYQVDTYTDHRPLLDRRDIDAVYLVTPPTVRLSIIKDCVEAGKDLLCEKPLALTADELSSIREVLRDSKIRAMVCFPERFTVSFQEAKAIVDQGLIGSIEYVRANFRFSMKKHGNLHGGWVFDRRTGGGLILESSVHLWDAIRWITGSEVTEVLGIAKTPVGEQREFENIFTAIARLENDGLACVDMSGSLPVDTPTDKRFEILGTEGCVYIDEFRNYLTVNSERGIEANPGDFVRGMTYPDVMWHSQIEGGVKRLQREFIRCILEDRQPPLEVRDGARATEITFAIIRSLTTRRMEQISYEW